MSSNKLRFQVSQLVRSRSQNCGATQIIKYHQESRISVSQAEIKKKKHFTCLSETSDKPKKSKVRIVFGGLLRAESMLLFELSDTKASFVSGPCPVHVLTVQMGHSIFSRSK